MEKFEKYMGSSSSNTMTITHRELLEVWRNEYRAVDRSSAVLNYICEKIARHVYKNSEKYKNVKKTVQNLCRAEKWASSSRNRDLFENRHKEWLDATVKSQIQKEAALPAEALAGPSGVGRPKKSFVDSSEHSKLSKLLPLIQQNSKEELILATRVNM
ncbi:unnamed protein product [Psylliodes chrysocephalus]|uniref:Uncharacterized protein n=1 Tax=Psylliodes chrysocephalus TaxID=3402493 RepID=A0A9P0CZU9_9CUCU|nr:unnamed protein product [Psylliodes chrysocephala]